MKPDPIRETITARAETLGLSAYAIGKATNIDPGTVKRYLAGRCALNSRYVSAISDYLDLEIVPRPSAREKRLYESGE